MKMDTDNIWFQRAAALVNSSDRHLFLTGKAGTGKTTFLQYIRHQGHKRSVVLAPTGVAAINAGGVTLHSFFQLPFGPFIPAGQSDWNSNYSSPHSLISNIRFNQDKKELLRELDLLIIDEISMVRADMLDAVDLICRHFRQRPHEPFGGLQLLYIGDLFQLPPVVKDEEWESILSLHYKSPFFFDAKVLEQQPPLVIELKKIYRQEEEGFIEILNQVRNNTITDELLETLNERCDRSFEPGYGESIITLTSHNAKAQAINQAALERLRSPAETYESIITGDFPEKAYPADAKLVLKEGAQVMFIKNDKGEKRQFYNGKLATVSRLSNDSVYVTMDDSPDELEVERETWQNIRYQFNREEQTVEEDELGSFKQYPLRLAWAITIHKSQGLTFEKAIVDAGSSFAAGQVYVALSRLTRLQGLTLYSYIHRQAIQTDPRVLDFVSHELSEDELDSLLETEQALYIRRSLLRFFRFDGLKDDAEKMRVELGRRAMPDKAQAAAWWQQFQQTVENVEAVAERFRQQLEQLIPHAPNDAFRELQTRVEKAEQYFADQLSKTELSLKEHAELFRLKQRTKKYIQDLAALSQHLQQHKAAMEKAKSLVKGMNTGIANHELLEIIGKKPEMEQPALEDIAAAVTPVKKGETKRISLELFRQGMSIEEIAKQRGLVTGTIETHLVSFIGTGELTLNQFLSEEQIAVIGEAIESLPVETVNTKTVKDLLGDGYSYSAIRAVLASKIST